MSYDPNAEDLHEAWKGWDIDKHDFLGLSSDNKAKLSPLKFQTVAGRKYGLTFMMKIDENDMACQVTGGMGATVNIFKL
jgi:hypothetical protein